jgi:CubicO group peptidase (beta-lactamase class C family)
MADMDFPQLRAVLAEHPEHGDLQLSVGHRGQAYELALGRDRDGNPIGIDTVVPWTCSSKPIGAIAFARAWDAGLLGPDDLVADHLPEYAAAGKAGVRVRDLLSHTTGVPDPLVELDPPQGAELPGWDELDPLIWSLICAAEPTGEPGIAMHYNPITNWFVLDRMLAAVTGERPGDSYRSTLAMLGSSATLGSDAARGRTADRVAVAATPDQAGNLSRLLFAADLPLPGTGVWGSMRELRRIGEALLAGPPLARSATIEAITCTHWPGSSRRVLSTTDFAYGLGFMTLPDLFGRRCSFRSYGHAGGNTSALLVDPAAGLVIALYSNLRLGDVPTVTRRVALVDAVYRDLIGV